MRQSDQSTVSECTPTEAWNALESQPESVLVDVRTRPEWSFVGVPDLTSIDRQVILSEWRKFPDMSVASDFAETVVAAIEGGVPSEIYFICRSGARSLEAAHAVSRAMAAQGQNVRCINVAEGFEGDLDAERHRGGMNGWKAAGLAWRQT